MANKKHSEILKGGVEVWNSWREDNPKIDPDLTGINFAIKFRDTYLWHTVSDRLNLEGIDFKGADLRGANFTNAMLNHAIFEKAILYSVDFTDASLDWANFKEAQLSQAIFNNTHLYQANFEYAIFGASKFSFAQACHVNLKGANLSGIDLSSSFFLGAIVNQETYFYDVTVDKNTDFSLVGLNNARIEPGLMQALQYNIRKKSWEKWYQKHKIKGPLVNIFWYLSDYGYSTNKIIVYFLVISVAFAFFYMIPGVVTGFEGYPECNPLKFLRSLYFSIVTMTTLGFGDIHAIAEPKDLSIFSLVAFGHILLIVQVIVGYVLLGALITRLSILFNSDGPAKPFEEKKDYLFLNKILYPIKLIFKLPSKAPLLFVLLYFIAFILYIYWTS